MSLNACGLQAEPYAANGQSGDACQYRGSWPRDGVQTVAPADAGTPAVGIN